MINVIILSILASLLASVAAGRFLRRLLPDHHLNAETRDAVKLAMGLVATMSALLLGLLVSSAKGTFDTSRNEVLGMAAKIEFLNRVLATYGSEADGMRRELPTLGHNIITAIWTNTPSGAAIKNANAFYLELHGLNSGTEAQRDLKTHALGLAVDIAETRALLHAQSTAAVSGVFLFALTGWLVVIFMSFSVLAPENETAATALVTAAVSVAGAIFLILELDHPFSGVLRISDTPITAAIQEVERSLPPGPPVQPRRIDLPAAPH